MRFAEEARALGSAAVSAALHFDASTLPSRCKRSAIPLYEVPTPPKVPAPLRALPAHSKTSRFRTSFITPTLKTPSPLATFEKYETVSHF